MRRWGLIPLVLIYLIIATCTPTLMLAMFGVGPWPTLMFITGLPFAAGWALIPVMRTMLREG